MELDKLKTHNFTLSTDSGDIPKGTEIVCTGNYVILDHVRGVVIETDGFYGKSEHNKYVEDDYIFENYIVLSLASFARGAVVFNERKVTKYKANVVEKDFNDTVEKFNNLYKKQLKGQGIPYYETRGGITLEPSDNEYGAFNLALPKVVEKVDQEVIKRLSIPLDILKELVQDSKKADKFFKQIEAEMKELGCEIYTFETPDGNFLRRNTFRKYAELRAYSKIKKEEK